MTRIGLLVSDLRMSRSFYRALGFRVVAAWPDGETLALAGNRLDLLVDAAAAAGPHYFTPEISRWPRGTGLEITLEVPDVERVHARPRRADADFVTPLAGRDFRVADPDGYLLRFVAAPDMNEARGGEAAPGFKRVPVRTRSSGT